MCGSAMAALHISSEEFFDMAPVEFYYAIKALGEQRESEFRQQLVIARTQAYMIINGQVGMKKEWLLKSPQELGLFHWEEGYDKVEKKEVQRQSLEEMKTVLMDIVTKHNEQIAKRESMKRTTPPVFSREHNKNKEQWQGSEE